MKTVKSTCVFRMVQHYMALTWGPDAAPSCIQMEGLRKKDPSTESRRPVSTGHCPPFTEALRAHLVRGSSEIMIIKLPHLGQVLPFLDSEWASEWTSLSKHPGGDHIPKLKDEGNWRASGVYVPPCGLLTGSSGPLGLSQSQGPFKSWVVMFLYLILLL